MFIESVLLIFTFILLAFASVCDVKTREVPDMVSYIFLLGVFGISLLYSLSTSFSFFLYALLGAALFFILGYIFYVTKQMGGADVKLLAGIGAVFANNSFLGFPLAIFFLIVLLFLGGIYTFLWGGVLYIKSFPTANKAAKELLQ